MNFFDAATGETYKGYKEEGYLPEAFVNFLALLVGVLLMIKKF
jgi:glutamyl-tRNA synthetase